MWMSDREKTRNNDFCSLLPKIGHADFIFIVISPKSFAMRLLYVNVVWMSKIRALPKNNFLSSDAFV